MDKLDRIESVAVPLPEPEIDTDAIFPARFLLVIDRKKYRDHLFADRRRDPAFALNQPQYAGAQIIVGGPRFGIGSSREHAVWALVDFGVRCIIAPDFGEIFRANCFKNGILPIALGGTEYAHVLEAAERAIPIVVDLNSAVIELPDKEAIPFSIDDDARTALLNGLDHIDLTLSKVAAIDAFEEVQRCEKPWLYLDIDLMKSVVQKRQNGQ